jgi:hypothetical protein
MESDKVDANIVDSHLPVDTTIPTYCMLKVSSSVSVSSGSQATSISIPSYSEASTAICNGCRKQAIWTKPPPFNKLTRPLKTLEARPRKVSRARLACETPPMTVSVNPDHSVPQVVNGNGSVMSSIHPESTQDVYASAILCNWQWYGSKVFWHESEKPAQKGKCIHAQWPTYMWICDLENMLLFRSSISSMHHQSTQAHKLAFQTYIIRITVSSSE